MDLNTFKSRVGAVVTNSTSLSGQSKKVIAVYKVRIGDKTFRLENSKTIDKWGKVASNKKKYSINGGGVCKREFLNELKIQ